MLNCIKLDTGLHILSMFEYDNDILIKKDLSPSESGL